MRGSTSPWASDRRDGPSTRPGPRSLPVEITRVEYLGNERSVHATLEATAVASSDESTVVDECRVMTVTALVDAEVEVDLWRPIHLEVDIDEIHLFDLGTGRAIPASDRVAAV